jgi:Uma2 family endonuclease
MNVAIRKAWTQDAFFAWAERQEGRYEFDGFQPVAMTDGNAIHSGLHRNILVSLSNRLRGRACQALGPDAGLATMGRVVRYPDVLVTCSPFKGTDRLIPSVVVVFEVISPNSGELDRIVKLREYGTVASILRYVIVESTIMGLTVFSRTASTLAWTAEPVTKGETLSLPEIGVELPMDEIYDGVDLPS